MKAEEILNKYRDDCTRLPLDHELRWSGWWDDNDVKNVMEAYAEAVIAERMPTDLDEVFEANKWIGDENMRGYCRYAFKEGWEAFRSRMKGEK